MEVGKMDGLLANVNGTPVIIPFGLGRPLLHDFRDFEIWLLMEKRFAEQLKCDLESGRVRVWDVRKIMENWAKEAVSEIQRCACLRVEERLIEIDLQLREAIRSGARPNLTQSLNILRCLDQLDITRLMILKNPQVVETMDLITGYEALERKGSHGKRVQVARKIEELKIQATKVLRNFRVLFDVPDDKSFSEVFEVEVYRFKKRISKIELDERLLMTDEEKEVKKKEKEMKKKGKEMKKKEKEMKKKEKEMKKKEKEVKKEMKKKEKEVKKEMKKKEKELKKKGKEIHHKKRVKKQRKHFNFLKI